jgi:DNA recombination protein RmuC
MSVISFMPWAIATLAVIGFIFVCFLFSSASKRAQIEAEALRSRIQSLEEGNGSLRDTAARLPDIAERATRAEAESEARLQRLSEASSMNATLQAGEQSLKDIVSGLETSLASERGLCSKLQSELQRIQTQASNFEASLRASETLLEENRKQSAELKISKEVLHESLTQVLQRATQAEAERDSARELQQRTHQFLTEAQTALRTSFTEAASKVFDEKSLALEQKIAASSIESKAGLQTTLQPLADYISQFQQRLEAITNENTKARSELGGKIEALVNLNQNMAAATESLTKALKGNSKVRGNWGEMVLESVLAASGLVEGSNYSRQPSSRDEETGSRSQPDVVVTMPDARKIIIDSKVNLIAWAQAVETDNLDESGAALLRHVAALRTHVRQLSERNYPSLYPGEALEITIAFIPIEAALSKALEMSPDLQREAFQKGIAFATPNTLMAMMQVIERLWVRDRLQQQIAVIGEEAAKLLDSVSSFLSDFDAVEQAFDKATKQLKQTRNRMETSPQSVLARAKRLVDAGARGKKKLHTSLITMGEPEALPLLGGTSVEITTDEQAEGDHGVPETG